jgi:hypothetical protein
VSRITSKSGRVHTSPTSLQKGEPDYRLGGDADERSLAWDEIQHCDQGGVPTVLLRQSGAAVAVLLARSATTFTSASAAAGGSRSVDRGRLAAHTAKADHRLPGPSGLHLVGQLARVCRDR